MQIGTDVVEVVRFNGLTDTFLKRVYTQNELDYAHKFLNVEDHLAGFFCAKEAFLKALGENVEGFSLKEIEVLHTDYGAPLIKLFGNVKKIFLLKKFKKISVTISHCSLVATSYVIVE